MGSRSNVIQILEEIEMLAEGEGHVWFGSLMRVSTSTELSGFSEGHNLFFTWRLTGCLSDCSVFMCLRGCFP